MDRPCVFVEYPLEGVRITGAQAGAQGVFHA
jgi:hypothetical protein